MSKHKQEPAWITIAVTNEEAKLLEAAPDLLQALKRMHAAFNAKKPIPTDEGNALEAMCRDTIAKAEGSS